MSHLGRRITNIFFAFVLAVMSVNLSGVLSLRSAFADAPGNKGTIKIGETELNDEDEGNANDPHISGCSLDVKLFNYTEGSHNATVTFTAQSPTAGQLVSVAPLAPGVFTDSFTFTGASDNGLNTTKTYTLAFTGAPQPQQGYHVKIDVTADGTKGKGAKSKVVWVEGCEPEKTKVSVPAAPATVDLCNPRGVTDNVAWANALPADTATIDWSQSQNGRTRTATLIGSDVVWSDNTTAPKVFTLPADNGIKCDVHVAPTTPTKFDTCGVDLDTYTIPSKTGVNYYVNGAATPTTANTYPATTQPVTITAQPQAGYVLDGTTSWTLTFPKSAACATPTEPTWNDVCLAKGTNTFEIPQVAGAKYYIKTVFGNYIPVAAGSHLGLSTVTIKAVAENGVAYGPWSHTFTIEPCDIDIETEPSMHEGGCGIMGDTYSIPSTPHVTYKKLVGYFLFIPIYQTIDAGDDYEGTGTVVIIAVPDPGYSINGKALWVFKFDSTPCDELVTPEAPTPVEKCGVAKDGVTIPEDHTGVIYTINGKPADDGFNPVTGSVIVVGTPEKGYTFGNQEYSWPFEFTNEACEPEPCVPSTVTLPELKMLQTSSTPKNNCEPGQGGAGGETPEDPKVPVVTELPQTGPEVGDTFAKFALIVAAGISTYGAMFFAVNRRELLKK